MYLTKKWCCFYSFRFSFPHFKWWLCHHVDCIHYVVVVVSWLIFRFPSAKKWFCSLFYGSTYFFPFPFVWIESISEAMKIVWTFWITHTHTQCQMGYASRLSDTQCTKCIYSNSYTNIDRVSWWDMIVFVVESTIRFQDDLLDTMQYSISLDFWNASLKRKFIACAQRAGNILILCK